MGPENCQIGVFLGYAGPKGHALIGRRLYVPKEWAEDAGRLKAAGVAEAVTVATKPEIGIAMAAALDAGVLCGWVLGSTVYGSDKSLRVMLENRENPYVLGIRANARLTMGGFHTPTAADLAAGLSADGWRRAGSLRGAGVTPRQCDHAA
ncbi:MAG: transposase [Methylocella sp.]